MRFHCFQWCITDQIADSATPFEKMYVRPFEGHVIRCGAEMEYESTGPIRESQLHKFGRTSISGLFAGCQQKGRWPVGRRLLDL